MTHPENKRYQEEMYDALDEAIRRDENRLMLSAIWRDYGKGVSEIVLLVGNRAKMASGEWHHSISRVRIKSDGSAPVEDRNVTVAELSRSEQETYYLFVAGLWPKPS